MKDLTEALNEIKYLRRIPVEQLKGYINDTLCMMPWEGFEGDLSDRITEWLNYFYWLFGETIDELQEKNYYRPEPQYLPLIGDFLSEYVKEYGKFMDSEKSWKPEYLELAKKDKRFRIEDYEEVEYKTFNEFFTRKVMPHRRAVSQWFLSPVDGTVLNIHRVLNGKVNLSVKSSEYHTINKLLDSDRYGSYNGTLIDIFLDVYDYHRIHAPCDMKILDIKKINGGNYVGGFVEYINGKYVLDSSEYGWQSIETRVVIEANHDRFDDFALVLVGMSHIGSIEINCAKGDTVKKCEEIGLFKFGGSCVLVIFNKEYGIIRKNKHFLMGETLFKTMGSGGA